MVQKRQNIQWTAVIWEKIAHWCQRSEENDLTSSSQWDRNSNSNNQPHCTHVLKSASSRIISQSSNQEILQQFVTKIFWNLCHQNLKRRSNLIQDCSSNEVLFFLILTNYQLFIVLNFPSVRVTYSYITCQYIDRQINVPGSSSADRAHITWDIWLKIYIGTKMRKLGNFWLVQI